MSIVNSEQSFYVGIIMELVRSELNSLMNGTSPLYINIISAEIKF